MRRDRWTDELLFEVARMRYEEGLTPAQIGAKIGRVAATVRKMVKEAEKRNIVQTIVIPSLPQGHEALRQEVREWFDLQEVGLVPGREDLMKDPCPEEKQRDREALVMLIARAAARYLEDHLDEGDVLAVPWGRMLSYISRQLRPSRARTGLVVVPMEGAMGVEAHRVAWSFEANAIASQVAAALGGRAWQLPAPAAADPQCYEDIVQHPLVHKALEKLQQASVAVVPIAPVDPENSTVVRMELLRQDQVERLRERGAVGEIASHWWFNEAGEPLTDEGSCPIGLGLDGLRRMVDQDERVIAVVGASEQRLKPLWVALRSALVNTLITDHVTAERLLELG